MSRERLATAVAAAVDEGLLPADAAALPPEAGRPWPVVVMIALGAWLAAIPLLIAVGLLLGDMLRRGVGPYLVGALLLAGAIVVLRVRSLPVFVEQLALPALLVGAGAAAFGLYRDLGTHSASLVLAVLALGVGWTIDRAWLRVLLGAAAAVCVAVSLVSERAIDFDRSAVLQFWFAWHATLVPWVLALWLQRGVLDRAADPGPAAAVESLAAGWLLAALAGFAWLSGMTFLVGAAVQDNIAGDIARDIAGRGRPEGALATVRQAVSAAIALCGMGWAAQRWPSLRRGWCAGAGVVLLGLAWSMPTLGAVLFALLVCAATQRWLQAGAAGTAAAWIVGAFYYQLRYPLGEKALLLVVAGVVLGALAWFALRGEGGDGTGERDGGASGGPGRRALQWGGIALALVLTLGVANFGIWQKEGLIARGQPVFVELAPVDPRSLMQGDFMRLNFRLPAEAAAAPDRLLASARPRVVARRDARGVAVPLRLERPGEPLGADEIRIELAPAKGRWILVTDAWYFKEGDAARWSRAKYGEFRVDADGRALLVGMADAELQPIRP